MYFLENIVLKTKQEVQEVHFSGKQYALHCSTVQPGDNKFVYYLSDDSTNDPSFVYQILEDIFNHCNICNETIIIKSDNAPAQSKNNWVFQSYTSLASKYNVSIIRLYGAAGHGKGLIDAMSNFGAKSFLRKDIVGPDVWFAVIVEICEYFDMRKDPRMSYSVVNQTEVDKKRMQKTARKIQGCMIKHLFDYRLECEVVFTKEFFCDCENCLDFQFDDCLRKEDLNDESLSLTTQ